MIDWKNPKTTYILNLNLVRKYILALLFGGRNGQSAAPTLSKICFTYTSKIKFARVLP